MLILTRKADESIVIGDNIVVKVISVDKGTVKIGIEAPSHISIMRTELLEAVAASNKEAAQTNGESFLDAFYKTFKR